MARPKENKKTVSENVEKKIDTATKKEEIKTIPENVEKLMKLYPQYDEFYVTPNGFVHPKGSPKYLVKDAVLYKNKYYKS